MTSRVSRASIAPPTTPNPRSDSDTDSDSAPPSDLSRRLETGGGLRAFMTPRYYMHDGASSFRFELAGALTAEDAKSLEQAWITASSVLGDRALVVDLTFVTDLDPAARDLLKRWGFRMAHILLQNRLNHAPLHARSWVRRRYLKTLRRSPIGSGCRSTRY